ncbi:MAG: hypothetical protein RJQ04_10010 [Longimicrobiales bacterium]
MTPLTSRCALAGALLALLGAPTASAHAMTQPEARADSLLRAEIDLVELGVEDPDDIRRGRIAVVHASGGARLSVRMLSRRQRTPSEPPERDSPFGAWLEEGASVDPAARVVRPSSSANERGLDRLLWVWNTRELLSDETARTEFLSFLRGESFTRVLLQLTSWPGERAERGFVPFQSETMAPLLAAIHALGVEVDALDGDRHYALPDNHDGVFRTVARVVEHNRSVAPAERFDGVRYDIEPYLLDGFDGPERQDILDGFVAVVDGVARIARDGGLRVGIDIPFWLDGSNDETGAYYMATLGGVEAPVLVHLFRSVDEVAVMDYRTRAEGSNGSLALARTELALARALGTRILLALESTWLPDEDLRNFRGKPKEGTPSADSPRVVILPRDGQDALVWLMPDPDARSRLLREVDAAGADRNDLLSWEAERPRRVPGSLLSFQSLGREAMDREARHIERRLRDNPAFSGTAYHHYGSLREFAGR